MNTNTTALNSCCDDKKEHAKEQNQDSASIVHSNDHDHDHEQSKESRLSGTQQGGEKTLKGLVPGGSLPGAYSVLRRATGEIPSWVQEDDADNADRSNYDPSNHAAADRVNDEEVGIGNSMQVFITEASTENPKQIFEGVKLKDTKNRRIWCWVAGAFVLFPVVALAAAMVVTFCDFSRPAVPTANDSNSNQYANMVPSPAPSGGYIPLPQLDFTMAPSAATVGNMSLTIAEGAAETPSDGPSITVSLGGIMFIEMLDRIDKNFTLFSVDKQASVPDYVDVSFVTKLVTPLWSCHVLDGLESRVVEGQVLALEDLYEGMELKSISGYPINIQLNPLRINSCTISETHRDLFFSNGVMHVCNNYPTPVVHWFGKSTLDILLETNDRRNGDLSIFLALVDAVADLRSQLEQQQDSNLATTVFVPTNAALISLDSSLGTITNEGQAINATLQLLLKNHFVTGNFARRCWTVIPTGTVESDTELRLDAQSGQVLRLIINDTVTINSDTTIVEEDIFSEDGIVHIIDKPLVLVSR